MRAHLIIGAFLWLVSSSLGFAGQPKYTTLVVEYAGVTIRDVLPVVISASSEEGEWYRRHLVPEPGHFVVHVEVVPASVLNEITELPLLKRELERAKPVDDEPKTPHDVQFTAGVGHDHVQIMVDGQTSRKILKDIGRVVTKYPTLKSELQAIVPGPGSNR